MSYVVDLPALFDDITTLSEKNGETSHRYRVVKDYVKKLGCLGNF